MIYRHKNTGKLARLLEAQGDTVILENLETKEKVTTKKSTFEFYFISTEEAAVYRYTCPICEQAVLGPIGLELTCETCEMPMLETPTT